MPVKVSSIGYVVIKSFHHFGEKAIPYKKIRTNDDGEVERQFILLDCQHGDHIIWLKRSDI